MRRGALVARTWRPCVSVLLLTVVLTLGVVQAASASEVEGWHWDYGTVPTVHKANDLFALDALHAWLVGDGGFIVATSDGGATWQEQDSDTVMDLNAVSFTDATHGWIVGDGTNILATTDGGITWDVLASDNATGFDDVDFIDASHGWGLKTDARDLPHDGRRGDMDGGPAPPRLPHRHGLRRCHARLGGR